MKAIIFEPTFEDWQRAARAALKTGLPPNEALWENSGETEQTLALFDAVPKFPGESFSGTQPTFRVPRKFLDLGKIVALHSDAAKWALLYRLLWRLTNGEPKLLEHPIDADVIAVNHKLKEVQKDAYRMRQYVRFRETRLENEPWFVAWYEPEHNSIRLNEKFFGDRFTNMRWSILTPKQCMHWDGESLTYSPGLEKTSGPLTDDVESLWVTYYSSIFNPARVKVQAMKTQMPVRNWKNLPETRVIAPLLATAPFRVNQMLQDSDFQQVQDSDYMLADPPQTTSWITVHDAAAACRACPLWKNATCTVFGEGPPDARVVLVGEQPGDSEDRIGKPFVGPAGQLLNRALVEAGIERSEIYVTNAVKHFKFEPRGKRRIHKTPNSREIASCRPWLAAELELIKPRLIVVLGSTAAQSVFNAPLRITEERGRILDSPFGPTLITVHPSALLRLPEGADKAVEFTRFVSDLRRVIQ